MSAGSTGERSGRSSPFFTWLVLLAASTLLSGFLGSFQEQLAEERATAAWQRLDDRVEQASAALEERLVSAAEPAQRLADVLGPSLAAEPDPQARHRVAAKALCEAAGGVWTEAAESCGAGNSPTTSRDAQPELGVWLLADGGPPLALRMRAGADGPERLGDDAALSLEPSVLAYQEGLIRPLEWATYPATASTHWTAQFAVPLYDADGKAIGMSFSRLGWDDLTTLVRAVELGRTGYAFVLSRSGELIGHPQVDRSAEGVSIASFALDSGDSALARAGERARRGEEDSLLREAPGSGELERLCWRRLEGSAWSVMAVSSQREVVGVSLQERRLEFGRSFSYMLVAYTAFAAALALLRPSFTVSAWCHSLAWSAVTMVATASLWTVGGGDATVEDRGVRIFDHAGLSQYLHAQERKLFGEAALLGATLERIPTGIFVQSLEFESANNARVTGMVWQRLPLDFDLANAGVIFAEAVEAEISEAYTRDIVEHEKKVGVLRGWSFRITVRERFDFARYPFDNKDVWLRMWPAQFDQAVVLIPDLEAYGNLDPGRTPGLDADFVRAGWNPGATFFQYREMNYSTDFGNRLHTGRQGFPELNFTLSVRRAFISTFVSDLIPLLVVASLLFGVLRTITRNHEVAERTGFDFTNVLGACSGVAFVVVLGHIQLRSALGGQPTTYLECYYFVMYGMLVLVGLNAWHALALDGPRYVDWHDNLAPRLGFWPVISSAILVATLAYFYPTQEETETAPAPRAAVAAEVLPG